MTTGWTWRRSAIMAAAVLSAVVVASSGQAGLISVLHAPTELLLKGDMEAVALALVNDTSQLGGVGSMADPIPLPGQPQPGPSDLPFGPFWQTAPSGLASAAGMSSPTVLTSGGSSGSSPPALAYWTFLILPQPTSGRISDRTVIILPNGPILELLRPA
ncbi:MAG: hypothetical protein ACUVQK_10035 [Thermogutta sp.]